MAEPMVQRLNRLERKVEALLVVERLSDRAWRHLDRAAKRPQDEAVRFDDLAGELLHTLDRRTKVAQTAACQTQDGEQSQSLADLDACYDRLHAVALALAATPVATLAQLRFKALAIKELAEENSDDVVHVLARSIAADLARIEGAG